MVQELVKKTAGDRGGFRKKGLPGQAGKSINLQNINAVFGDNHVGSGIIAAAQGFVRPARDFGNSAADLFTEFSRTNLPRGTVVF